MEEVQEKETNKDAAIDIAYSACEDIFSSIKRFKVAMMKNHVKVLIVDQGLCVVRTLDNRHYEELKTIKVTSETIDREEALDNRANEIVAQLLEKEKSDLENAVHEVYMDGMDKTKDGVMQLSELNAAIDKLEELIKEVK